MRLTRRIERDIYLYNVVDLTAGHLDLLIKALRASGDGTMKVLADDLVEEGQEMGAIKEYLYVQEHPGPE